MKEKTLGRLAIVFGTLCVLCAVHSLYFWGSIGTAEAGRSVAEARYERCLAEAAAQTERCVEAEAAVTQVAADVDALRLYTRLAGLAALVFAVACAASGFAIWRRRKTAPTAARA